MKTVHKESGSSLIVVISVLATLMVIVGVAAQYTQTINRHVQRSNTLQSAIAVGDSCIDIMFTQWRAICSVPGNVNTPQTTKAFQGIELPTAAQLNLPNVANFAKAGTDIDPANDEYDANYTISNFKVVAVTPEWKALSSATAVPIPTLGQIVDPVNSVDPLVNPKIKTTPLVYNYMASVDVTLPALGLGRRVVAKVRRVFQKQQLSPWNFAIFYVDPLEIHPGPPFTVTGWVHTNSDLFTGNSSLTFANKVTFGADWLIGFKPGETYHTSTPASPSYPSNLPPTRDQMLQPFGLDSTSIFSTTDPNPNNDSYRELIEQPVAGYTDPLTGMRYYDQAAIKILINGSNVVTVKKLDGTTVSSTSTGTDKQLYNAVIGALTTNQTIQDQREGAPVRLTTVDMGSINNSLNAPTNSSSYIDSNLWNGIIYIADTSATSSQRRGIRLKNGRVLPTDGVTIASSNPVYIQGDFNTGNGSIPSNDLILNDPTRPQANGYTRQPAAVIADAVNILSNNWNDANAGATSPLSARIATNTTVNAAIVSGIVPSSPVGGDGSYSGGAENFPRFHEDWGGSVKFTYYGSMVELYNSQQAIGSWKSVNAQGIGVYGAPDRQWYFDNNFKTKPPRGSLMIYSYVKGQWSAF